MSKYYYEGFDAYCEQWQSNSDVNPYTKGTFPYEQWEDGYSSAWVSQWHSFRPVGWKWGEWDHV